MFNPSHPISDTAFLVAYYRALESERRDALFHDPWAKRLAGDRGLMWGTILPDLALATVVIAVRTRVLDDLLLDIIARAGIQTVVNLGAGLDTRPYRLALPPSLRWYEVDSAEILDYKQNSLALVQPQCQLQAVKLNLTDVSALQNFIDTQINPEDNALILSEGILGYLSPDQVSQLMQQITRHAAFRWWLLELLTPSPLLPKSPSQKLFSELFTPGQDALQFAPPEGGDFFAVRGWHVDRCLSLWQEMTRLGRQFRGARLWECLLRRIRPQFWRALVNSNSLLLLEKATRSTIQGGILDD